MARDNRDRDRGGRDRDRDDRGGGISHRSDFATNILEAIGERGGEIFGANVGGMLKNRTVAKVAQFFGESGISPDWVLNNLPYITTLPILNDFFNESAEGVLRGLSEHLRARLAAMPSDPDQRKAWISKELDAYKVEAKKSLKSPTAATQHLFQVVAGLGEGLLEKFDEMLLALPKDGDSFSQAKVLDEGRKRVVTRDEIVAIITTKDADLRVSKLKGLLQGAPLLNPPKEGLAAFADELAKEAAAQADGLKPDGKYVKGFATDAEASAKRNESVANAIDDVLKQPPLLQRIVESVRRWL
jgi:hypothetical protein